MKLRALSRPLFCSVPDLPIIVNMDILDRRKFPSSAADLVLFGVEDITLLTAYYGARPMFENGATVLAEWETYKRQEHRGRPP